MEYQNSGPSGTLITTVICVSHATITIIKIVYFSQLYRSQYYIYLRVFCKRNTLKKNYVLPLSKHRQKNSDDDKNTSKLTPCFWHLRGGKSACTLDILGVRHLGLAENHRVERGVKKRWKWDGEVFFSPLLLPHHLSSVVVMCFSISVPAIKLSLVVLFC